MNQVESVIDLSPRGLNSEERKAELAENERFKKKLKNTNLPQ